MAPRKAKELPPPTGEGVSFRHPIFFEDCTGAARTRRYARLFQVRDGVLTDVTNPVSTVFEWQRLRGYFKKTRAGWVATLPVRKKSDLQAQLSRIISCCIHHPLEVQPKPLAD